MDWNLFTGERAGTDALLLADFAKDAHGTYGADLGCGSGILLLLLLLGDESRRMTGVDILKSAARPSAPITGARRLRVKVSILSYPIRRTFRRDAAPYRPTRSAPRSAPKARPFRSSAPPPRGISNPAGNFFSSTGESVRATFLRRCTTPISRRCAGGTFSPRRESARPFFSWKP